MTEDTRGNVEVIVVRPQMYTNFLCAVYFLLFFLGFCGNLISINMILEILRQNRLAKLRYASLIFCTLFLNIIDFTTCFSLPVLLINYFTNQWFLGDLLCKIFWLLENAAKIASKLVLMIMSIERFVAIVNSKRNFIGGINSTVFCLTFAVVFVVVSMVPVYFNSGCIQIFEAPLESLLQNESANFTPVTKCLVMMSEQFTFYFTLYLFAVGFCLPTTVILLCYMAILTKLFLHNRSTGDLLSRQVSLKRVLKISIISVTFYLVCWTPYWISTLLMIFANAPTSLQEDPLPNWLLTYVVHPLVYLNAAINWVPYMMLNTDLR